MTHNILLLTGLDVAVPAMLLITLFQVYTCTTKLLEIETDLRRMRVRFFLLCIKTCISGALLRGAGKGRGGCNYVSGI